MHERSARARIRTVVITAVLTLLASMLSVVFAIPAAAASCPDVVVIGARGSAEQPQPPNTVASAAKDPSKFYGIGEALYKNVYKSFYDGATANNLVVDVSPVNYSAVPVARILTGQFTASVQEGVTNTLDQIQEVVNRPCAVTPQIVLMGYSQGALVVTTALSQLQTSERKAAIKAVYLIGDPLYDSTQPFSHGHAGGGNGLITNGVLQFLAPILAGRWSIEGLAKNVASLAKATKPLPTELSNRAYDFCEPRDPMCQPMYAGLGTVAKFFAGRHTPHDDYKLRVNKDAVTWLTNR